ncbi:MAG: hypothetical protein KGY80_08045 [Candidatus Thorarchaeota archaeon]|nr:hypothetical protein [Candidatus Thorarchaeota archaeon]
MSRSSESTNGGLAGVGKWIAISSELPCSVVVMVFVGQILGRFWFGQSGALWGVLIGALVGFFFGSYSVYMTIQYYDKMEKQDKERRAYRPTDEEISKDYDFDSEDEKEL